MPKSFQVRVGSYRARFMPTPDPDTSPGALDKVADIIFDAQRPKTLLSDDIEKVLREFGYEPLPNVQVFTVTIETEKPVFDLRNDILGALGTVAVIDSATVVEAN